MQPEVHEGELLARYFNLKGIPRKEACTLLGINNRVFSYHCHRAKLSNSFISKLSASGVHLFDTEEVKSQFLAEQNKKLEDRIKMLDALVELQKEFITHVTRNCNRSNCLNFVFDKKY